jgi:hypothetical protein
MWWGSAFERVKKAYESCDCGDQVPAIAEGKRREEVSNININTMDQHTLHS